MIKKFVIHIYYSYIWLLMSDLLSRSVGSNATFRIGLLGTAAEFPGIFGQVARVIGLHPEYLEVLQADGHSISATKEVLGSPEL